MSNSNGFPSSRNWAFSGKHLFLPPKGPFAGNYPSYIDFIPSLPAGSTAVQRPGEGNLHHQRTSSESFLMEDQPSWLDDLLNEPESPVQRGGHRRSSSDSFAYLDVANSFHLNYALRDGYKRNNVMSIPSWGFQEFDQHGAHRYPSCFAKTSHAKQKNKSVESSLNIPNHHPNQSVVEDNLCIQSSRPSSASSLEGDRGSSTLSEKQEQVEQNANTSKASSSSDKKDTANVRSSSSDADNKRAKQQFAQRSRVRKLQYISELERNMQALQAEGSEVSAEIDFLNQQHLILTMENKALRQRLDNLSHEQLIKTFEHDILEREVIRLRGLYQQQQHQQQQLQQSSSGHKRSNSKDLNIEFSNLSLKH